MTFENRKRLYDIYVERGMTERAEAISKVHPDVLEKPKEEKPVKETKSKGKK